MKQDVPQNYTKPDAGVPYVLVGLTGSIGSGKSAVGKILEEHGIPVLQADAIAKELMNNDPELRQAIIQQFGPMAYRDGELNKSWIAEQIFSNPAQRAAMNNLVHPRTIAEQGRRAVALANAGKRVVVCEAALMYESGGVERFDYIVVVDAKPEIRYQRAALRDAASVQEIQRRDAAQIPAAKKVEMADFVIRNDGTEAELRRNAMFIIMLLQGLPPRREMELPDDLDEDPDDSENDGIAPQNDPLAKQRRPQGNGLPPES
ncbi:MAG: dephospho-CoA kinase [Chlorobi bacterium]|nr:MAG: dephospho-CoA kinase [Chlorobi bacterium OLB7]MBK8912398.1 dephospho-CoA kinase [Chlorobiota bacterium]MBX7217750.1 dephospho-CoA kinase [Candidatus Kapabacteria bacterium]